MPRKPTMPAATVISRERLLAYMRSKYNPLMNLTAELLKSQHAQFDAGYLRAFAVTAEHMRNSDDVLAGVAAKREKAPAVRGYEILMTEESDAAQRHKDCLEYFYDNLTAVNAVDENERGGVGLLLRQMMTATSYRYARHNIVWQPSSSGITAEMRFVPLCFFENTTGTLRFLPHEGAITGIEPEPDVWLTTVGDGLMRACSIAWYYKHTPLRDWLIYCVRHVMPGIYGKTSATLNSPEWKKMEEAVADIAAEWSGVIGGADEVKTLDLGARGELPYPKLIERADRSMAALYRGGDLSTMSSSDGQGSGATQQGPEAQILEASDSDMLSEALNMYVDKPAIRFHLGDETPLAYIKIRTTTRQNVTQDLEVDQALRGMGYPITLKSVSERYARPLPEDGEEVLPPPVTPAAAGTLPALPTAANERPAAAPAAKAEDVNPKLVAEAVAKALRVRETYVEAFVAQMEARAAQGTLTDRELLDALEEMAQEMPELFDGRLVPDVAAVVEGLLGSGVANKVAELEAES